MALINQAQAELFRTLLSRFIPVIILKPYIMAGIVLMTLLLPFAASHARAQTPAHGCSNKLDRATSAELKQARHGEWTLSEDLEPETLTNTILLAHYRTLQEWQQQANELSADWCAGFECTDRHHCQPFQPFHPDDPDGPKAINAANGSRDC